MRGSKGLKGKNLITLKPLIYFAIEKIFKNELKYTCISSDDKKIIKTSERYGLKNFFIRPKKLALSNVSKLEVWKHALEKAEIFYKKKFKFLLDVEVTNPLTTAKDLNSFLNNLKKLKTIMMACFALESLGRVHFLIF